MRTWLKVNEVADILNVGKAFLRTIICKEEFREFVADEKPILIHYNNDFKSIIKKYITKKNKKRGKLKKTIRDEVIQCQIKHVIVNEKILRGWTQSAIDCYNIGCNCSKCIIKKSISSECCMKQTVILLVKKFGKPNKDNFMMEEDI